MPAKLTASGLSAAALAAGLLVAGAPAANAATTMSANHSTTQVHAAASPHVENDEDDGPLSFLEEIFGDEGSESEAFLGEAGEGQDDNLLGLFSDDDEGNRGHSDDDELLGLFNDDGEGDRGHGDDDGLLGNLNVS